MFLKKTMTILKQITNLQQPYHSKLEKMFPYLQIKRGSSNVKAIMIFHIVWLSQCNTLALVLMSFTYYMIVFTLSLRGVQQDGWAGHHLDGASADLYPVTIYRYMFLGVKEDWC